MTPGNTYTAVIAALALLTVGLAGCVEEAEVTTVGCTGSEDGTAAEAVAGQEEARFAAHGTEGLVAQDTGTELQPGTDVPALKLGTILPLTGDLSPYGPSAERAVQLAVQHVNDAGGVNGEEVELVTADSETNEDAASQAASQLIDVEEVHGIVGAMGSGISHSFLDQVVSAEIPMISPSNTGTDFTELSETGETDGWYFRTVPSDALQGAVMAQLAADEGYETASILAINNAYGTGFGDVFQASFEEAGGQVLDYVRYDPDGTDFSSDVGSAASDDPDVIVAIGYPDTGRIFMQNAFDRGHAGGNPTADWLFSEGFNDQSGFVDELATVQFEGEDVSIIEGCMGTTPQELTDERFINDFQDAYDEEPALFADRTYDAAMLLMLASEHCDCVEGQAFQEAIVEVQNPPGQEVEYDASQALLLLQAGQDIEWTGAAGPLEFDENHDVTAPYAVWQVNDGQIETIETGIVP